MLLGDVHKLWPGTAPADKDIWHTRKSHSLASESTRTPSVPPTDVPALTALPAASAAPNAACSRSLPSTCMHR